MLKKVTSGIFYLLYKVILAESVMHWSPNALSVSDFH
jgi:hypothetical protein